MDALQARFRDKASEMLHTSPTITVALGHGHGFIMETCYFVGDSDELHCIIKPNPVIVEAVQDDAHVAFTVNQGFPNHILEGTGRAFFVGRIDRHPLIREQTLTKTPDATGFLTTIRNLGVLKILPDRISITDDANLGLGPRPVYVPEAARALPDRRQRWVQAINLSSWPLILIPVAVAAMLASDTALQVTWWLLVPIVAVAIFTFVGTTLLATHVGFWRHIDRGATLGSSRLLHEGLVPARFVRYTGIFCLGVGFALGLFLVGPRGTPLLAMGLIGVAGGLLYTGWPIYLTSRVFEEGVVFICLGPLAVLGAHYGLTGVGHAQPLLVSLPIGFLAASIIYASHLRTFREDVNAKIYTLAVMLGWQRARLFFYALVTLPYCLLLILILVGLLPVWSWLAFLSLPLAGRGVWSVWQASAEPTQNLESIDRQMVQAYVVFGMLLVLGLILR